PDPNNFFLNGDGIYLDPDISGTVSAGDTRITPPVGSGLAAGAVAAANTDVARWQLVNFRVPEKHDALRVIGEPGDTLFLDGDHVYVDNDNSGTVTVGDTRVT